MTDWKPGIWPQLQSASWNWCGRHDYEGVDDCPKCVLERPSRKAAVTAVNVDVENRTITLRGDDD